MLGIPLIIDGSPVANRSEQKSCQFHRQTAYCNTCKRLHIHIYKMIVGGKEPEAEGERAYVEWEGTKRGKTQSQTTCIIN